MVQLEPYDYQPYYLPFRVMTAETSASCSTSAAVSATLAMTACRITGGNELTYSSAWTTHTTSNADTSHLLGGFDV